jgi:methionyl-tRNA synthetase
LTGTDEHGLKIQEAAETSKVAPQLFCDDISARFRNVFDRYDISYTDYIRTTEDRHKVTVGILWQKLQDAGFIYLGQHQSWYSVSDETFLTDSQVMDVVVDEATGEKKKVSKESGHAVVYISEDNYKFKLSAFQERILEWLDSDPNLIIPHSKANEVRNFVLSGLKDLSVSRPSDRIEWGIPVPGNKGHVIYVWLDALANYLTAAHHPLYSDVDNKLDPAQSTQTLWPVNCHVIGKDILKFHTVYWPAFLMAVGLELPKKIVAHSHWTVDKVKMSKSLGNVVDPLQLIDDYGLDASRFFLLHEGGISDDCDFSFERLRDCLNSTLADTIGNLASRSLTSTLLPDGKAEVPHCKLEDFNEMDNEFISKLDTFAPNIEGLYEDFNFCQGLRQIMSVLHSTNQYFSNNEPWKLKPKYSKDGKTLINVGDPKRLAIVMYNTLEALRISCA